MIDPGEEAACTRRRCRSTSSNSSRTSCERLQLLGVTTLGELAALPHGPFVRRFGPDAARWHDAARGIDRSPFVPRGHAITIEAAMLGEGQRAERGSGHLCVARIARADLQTISNVAANARARCKSRSNSRMPTLRALTCNSLLPPRRSARCSTCYARNSKARVSRADLRTCVCALRV